MPVAFNPIGDTCDQSALSQFEKQYSVELPLDYRRFLIEHNGGVPSKKSIILEYGGIDLSLDVLFGIHDDRRLDVRFWTSEWQYEMPNGFVVMGRDPGGGMYIIGTKSDAGVYFWDHQHSLPGSSEENGNTFHIAQTFTMLLDILQ
jgi:hypothetical protein